MKVIWGKKDEGRRKKSILFYLLFFSASLINELGGATYTCKSDELVPPTDTPGFFFLFFSFLFFFCSNFSFPQGSMIHLPMEVMKGPKSAQLPTVIRYLFIIVIFFFCCENHF